MRERKATYVTAARGAGIPIPEPQFMQQKAPKSKKEKKKVGDVISSLRSMQENMQEMVT